MVGYHQFLKGGVCGTGPSKEELRLRAAQHRAERTGDPVVLRKALLDMPGADEFCTRDPHLEGEEVFGSQKRKLDTTIGADDETHRPDTINFSRPRAAKRITRARVSPLPTIVEERDPDEIEVVPSPPSATGVRHVTVVEETRLMRGYGTLHVCQRLRARHVGPNRR